MKNSQQKENPVLASVEDELSEDELVKVSGGTVKGAGVVQSGASTISSSLSGTLGLTNQSTPSPKS